MSEATRAMALDQAVKIVIAQCVKGADVLPLAEQYNEFLTADSTNKTAGATTAKPATTAAKPAAAAAKPAAAKPAAKPAKTEDDLANEAIAAQREREAAQDAAEAAGDGGPTKEQVGEAINAMLAANLRKEAVALLAKFGAKSVSGVPVEKYAELVEEAEGLLVSV